MFTYVSVINKFDTGSDHRLLQANIIMNGKIERNKLIAQKRFLTLLKL